MLVSIRTIPSRFHNSFESATNVHQYSTRQATKNDIFLTRKNTLQYGIRSMRFFGAKSWNNIPVDIKDPHLLSIFVKGFEPFYL